MGLRPRTYTVLSNWAIDEKPNDRSISYDA